MSEDCGLGGRLADAQKGGFFSWFCLSEVGADDPQVETALDPPWRWQRFRPNGPRFHDLVELAVGLNETACIGAADLCIARSFIESPAIRPFARDIAKSFLNWVLPEEAGLALRHEIELIGAFADGESVVIAHADAPRPRWLYHALGRGGEAEVFMGSQSRSRRHVGQTHIAFENRAGPPDEKSTSGSVQPGRWLSILITQA
jgi:hypothetical protein